MNTQPLAMEVSQWKDLSECCTFISPPTRESSLFIDMPEEILLANKKAVVYATSAFHRSETLWKESTARTQQSTTILPLPRLTQLNMVSFFCSCSKARPSWMTSPSQ